jgi:hypothetical protein
MTAKKTTAWEPRNKIHRTLNARHSPVSEGYQGFSNKGTSNRVGMIHDGVIHAEPQLGVYGCVVRAGGLRDGVDADRGASDCGAAGSGAGTQRALEAFAMDRLLDWAKQDCLRVAIEIFLLEKRLRSIREIRNDVTTQVLAERRIQLAELSELISECEAHWVAEVIPRQVGPQAYGRALFKSELTKETHDYVNRGRSFASASDDNLRREWVMAVRHWMAPRDASHAREVDDLAAEMRLRSLKAPYEEISPELKAEVTGRGSPERPVVRTII